MNYSFSWRKLSKNFKNFFINFKFKFIIKICCFLNAFLKFAHLLLKLFDSDNKDKINNRRNSQSKIYSLRRSIFYKDNNIPYQIIQLKNRKKFFFSITKK